MRVQTRLEEYGLSERSMQRSDCEIREQVFDGPSLPSTTIPNAQRNTMFPAR